MNQRKPKPNKVQTRKTGTTPMPPLKAPASIQQHTPYILGAILLVYAVAKYWLGAADWLETEHLIVVAGSAAGLHLGNVTVTNAAK